MNVEGPRVHRSPRGLTDSLRNTVVADATVTGSSSGSARCTTSTWTTRTRWPSRRIVVVVVVGISRAARKRSIVNRTGRKPSRPPASSALRAANAQVAGPVNVALAHMLRATGVGWNQPSASVKNARFAMSTYYTGVWNQ